MMMNDKKLIIAVDFDGTVLTHAYPSMGKDIGAIPVLKELVRQGHRLILYSMRSGITLNDAIMWFHKNDIPLFGVNYNPEQLAWTSSTKVYANIYIDDAALGCPLIRPSDGSRSYVDWTAVAIEFDIVINTPNEE
jgi:hypothetical protein